jgi:peptidoglycan hydrolase CwlO-like protein
MRIFNFQFSIFKCLIITALLVSSYGIWEGRYGDVGAVDQVQELQKQIDELSKMREMSEAATKPLESELVQVRKKLETTRIQIRTAEAETVKLEQDIETREDELVESYQYLAVRVRSLYKLSRQFSPFLSLLSAHSAAGLTRELSYRAAAAEQDKMVIIATTEEILKLEEDREAVVQRKEQLAALRVQFEKNAAFFDKEIKDAKAYQEVLAAKIAELSKRQQEILAAKTGTFQTTVGEVPMADDAASRPDFNPGFSPAFAAFSFGAPHFKGMSQYGAYGRAKSGQGVEEILRAYYGGGIEIKKDYDTGIQIRVEGHGTVDIETYTKRIYEVPNRWGDDGGMEALKAQAVAARSYALARTNNGEGSICATEACQVYKPQDKGGKWEEAVNATRGWVLMANGKPFSSMYASTSGGYQMSYSYNGHSTPGFWDTSEGRAGWTSKAYELVGGSPWFYKAWYRTRSGDACGRSHPWLTPAEMADILNAWAVLIKSGEGDDRITPIGGCWGGNPYSVDELRSRSAGAGGGYVSVTSVSVSYAENGITANLTFGTDKGSVTISGADFKKAFNLRAPGNISIKSNLFNVERK